MNSRQRTGMMAAVVLGTLTTLAPAAGAADPAAISDHSRYCTACWRNARLDPDSWTDCTQDVFLRLVERVTPANWRRALAGDGSERREFLRAIDAVKKRSQRNRKYAELHPDAVVDRQPDEAVADQRMVVEQAAASLLSPRQQQIIRMSFEGWSVAEIARQLGIGPERVSDEKYKAIRKLRQHLSAQAD